MKKRWLLVPLVLLTVPVFAFQARLVPIFGAAPSDEDRARFAASDAYDPDAGAFQNRRPDLFVQMREDMEFLPMLGKWFTKRVDGRPASRLPEQQPDMQAFLAPGSDTRVIWFGHSTFLLNIAGTTVLVDPVFSETAAPVGFTAKRFQPPVLSLDKLPPVDIILISHDHYDHLDTESVKFFADGQTQFITPLGVGAHLVRWGISQEKIIERDWWQEHVSHGITFTAAPAQHFSGRDGINNNETLWASWVLATPDTRLYFSGDSGYDTHFADIGKRLGPFDLAFMENGQYDETWPYVHMRPAETIQAFKDVNASRMMPVHWGMFELAFHTWYAPVASLSQMADQEGIDLVTPMLGEMFIIDNSLETSRWWNRLIMRILDDRLVFSPSDLSGFLSSPFASWMDRFVREFPDEAPAADVEDALLNVLAKRGLGHEAAFEQRFRDAGLDVVNIDERFAVESSFLSPDEDVARRRALTVEAIKAGIDIIAQATLVGDRFAGVADFLVKVPGRSKLGDFHYEVWDTKLARRIRPGFVIQLCCYVDMLEQVQGCRAEYLVVALGNDKEERVPLVDCLDYYRALKQQFLQLHDEWHRDELPSVTGSSSHGRWSGYVKTLLESIDHLSQVATITGTQIARLEAAGIQTRAALAERRSDVPGIDPVTLQRLATQASLQIQSQGQAVPAYRLLGSPKDVQPSNAVSAVADANSKAHGLSRLPSYTAEDVFFDIEGFPLDEGGLEYLWGCTFFDEQGERQFRDWWAHDSVEERRAFEGFIDWVYARWRHSPDMHVYHYANYEIAACQRLMGRYGTREHELDELLRGNVFVDLYVLVQQSLQVGEPRYSIKNVERLYRGGRDTDVGSGSDSVVVYEYWREQHDAGLEGDSWQSSKTLKGIRDYNIDDCNSTQELVDWLRERQLEHDIPTLVETDARQEEIPDEVVSARLAMRDQLLVNANSSYLSDDHVAAAVSENMAGLLEFHRREAKPVWWRYFDRHGSTPEQLMHDPACLAQCQRTGRKPFKPTERARNLAYEYRFRTGQDFKGLPSQVELHGERVEGDKPHRANVLHALSDFAAGLVVLQSASEPPSSVTLIPNEFVNPAPIPDAIDAVVEQWLKRPGAVSGIDDFLFRRAPRFKRPRPGAIAQGDTSEARLAATIEAVLDLDDSYLTIQGPPGCGKSYTGARIIAALCARGCKVGISSNSHAAIQNLMKGAARYCQTQGIAARFICTRQPDDELLELGVDVTSNARLAATLEPSTVVGTTAWGFARADLEGEFDYLLIDEAGQVSVANLLAMSRAARNLVLLGDQMQLGQPSQGSHPADSGLSVLDYLLQGKPTIDETMGVFLGTTYRMHSRINRFVSERFYEGRLQSVPQNDERELLADDSRLDDISLQAGIRFVPVMHEGNSQSSEEEAQAIRRIAENLLGQHVRTSAGADTTRPLDWDDLLFVAPYNQQVKLLQESLGERARVGSVDRFQGQEAAVVFLSLCSSDAAEAPRGIDFLFNPNRLNVAISRAQTLVIVVGNPGLATTRVSTVEQLRKVNLVAGLLYQSIEYE